MDSHSLSSCIIGMSKMDISWSRIPTHVKIALDQSINRINNGKITEQSVGNILWGLGSMGANKANLSPGTIDSIYDMICTVSQSYKSQGISNTLYGLAKMNWRWIDLPPKVIDSIEKYLGSKYGLQNMPDYSIANIIWSLGHYSLTHSLTHLLTYLLIHSLTHSLTLILTHSHTHSLTQSHRTIKCIMVS
jgi:hypothetical protein